MYIVKDEWNIQEIHVCNYNGCVHRLWWSMQINHIAFDDQYAVTDAVFVHAPYRDRQYFNCGVPDLVPWVLLVSTAKQEPANKNLE